MSDKRLSEIMSDSNHAIEEAQEALENAILEGIGTHFDAGVQIERERIIKLLESLNCPANGIEHDCNNDLGDYTPSDLIGLIKGEQK